MTRLAFRECSISWLEIGAKDLPPLIICHGMAGDHREFIDLAERLSNRWRVLLWDMPGHGASQPMLSDIDTCAMVDALEAVLANANVGEAVLLGFSFGGVVAQIFAKRHPERVTALVAYACYAPYSQAAPVPRWMISPLTWLTFGRRSWDDLRLYFARLCAEKARSRAHIVQTMRPLGRAGFVAMTEALLNAIGGDERLSLNVPVLIVSGDKDSNRVTLAKARDGLVVDNPQAQVLTLCDAGHCAHLDQPEAFAAAIERFLASSSPARHPPTADS